MKQLSEDNVKFKHNNKLKYIKKYETYEDILEQNFITYFIVVKMKILMYLRIVVTVYIWKKTIKIDFM